ncbi:MAG: glycosyltransferase family 2 protein [Candidatus Binatales bacterium]
MKLSIIIATHARPDMLARLIESLAPQLTPERELFIADNGTPEPSPIPEAAPPLTHLHDARPGKCRIQNRAIAAATGDVIVFLDDDLVVAPRFLDQVERFFDDHPEFAAMKGRILPAEDPARKAGPKAVYLDLPIADHGEDVIEVRGVLGANMAFRRAALDRVGNFDERLGPGAAGHEEETEISARIRRAGLKIGYAPRAVVYHEVDPGRADRQRFLRVAHERGRCRMIHERHSRFEVTLKILVASVRVGVARALGAPIERIAREEQRLAIAHGMREGLALSPLPQSGTGLG